MAQGDLLDADYELTVTTGLERIAADEVKEKLHIVPIVEKGRLRMRYSGPVDKFLKLRCINNVFVTIFNEKQLSPDKMPSKETLEPFLFAVADKCDWKTGLVKWREVSKFSSPLEVILENNVELKSKQPLFRVTCDRTGEKHLFQSPDVCVTFGHVLDTNFGWPIKMKNFDLEVLVAIYENDLNVSLTLTPQSLDKRNIATTGWTTLRGSTCYAMLRMAELKRGDIVVDPMAGSGAIPIECSIITDDNEFTAFSIAGELKANPLDKCKYNFNSINAASLSTPTNAKDILRLDVKRLPFRRECVDVFVSDLPFGRRHGSKSTNFGLYASLLGEMARVARRESGRAVLLTQDRTSMKYALDKNADYWLVKVEQFVKVGNLPCFIYSLSRTSTAAAVTCVYLLAKLASKVASNQSSEHKITVLTADK